MLLQSGSDGFAQMADYLQGRSGLDSVQLLSHGASGQISAGSSTLNADTIASHSAQLETIGAALKDSGDFLIYGCNVAQGKAGEALVQQIARITHADVAASDDLTGATSKGGDWVLEYHAGAIETPVNLGDTSGFAGVLVNQTINLGGAITSGSLASGEFTIDGLIHFKVTSASGFTVTQDTTNGWLCFEETSANGDFQIVITDTGADSQFKFVSVVANNQSTGGAPGYGAQLSLGISNGSSSATSSIIDGTQTINLASYLAACNSVTVMDLELNISGTIYAEKTKISLQTLIVDLSASIPSLTSITLSSPADSTTNADSLTWRITFSEAVKNVDAADFVVSGTTATVTGVTAVSTSVYNVTVSGGDLANLEGSVYLTLAAGHNIVSTSASVALSSTTPSGTNDNFYNINNNTVPTLAVTAVNPTYTENGSAVDLFSGVTAATNDTGQTFTDMTLTVTNVSNGSSEVLNIGGTAVTLNNGNSGTITGIGSYSVSVSGSTATVALSGMTRSDAQMGALIDGISYSNLSDNPGSSSLVATITGITDSGSSHNSANPGLDSTVSVTPVNDVPVLSANAGLTVNEGAAGTAITAAKLAVSDVDNTAAQRTYTLVSTASNGTLWVDSDGNGTVNGAESALGINGTFTQADIDSGKLKYSHNGSETTSDGFSFTVSDGSGGTLSSTTFAINVNAVNDAPTVTASGGTAAFTEASDIASTPVIVDSGITVADIDSPALASATVGITGNFQGVQDVLAFTNINSATYGNIAASYAAGTGVLTLTSSGATATVAQWQAALRAVTYTNSSDAPNTSTRTISFVVNDGSLDSIAGTRTVSVSTANDAPTGIALSGGTVSTYDAANATVGTLTTTDVDSSAWTYSIQSISRGGIIRNNDSSIFSLADTGLVAGTTLRATAPGTTTTGAYTVVVRAADADGLSYDQTLTVNVSNALIVTKAADDAFAGGTYAAELLDGGGLSLREAVGLANTAGGGAILFGAGLATTAVNSELAITTDITLVLDAITHLFVNSSNCPITIAAGKTLTIQTDNGDYLHLDDELISGSGNLSKTGNGALFMQTDAGYDGTITISGGTLEIKSGGEKIGDAATVMVNSGGTLSLNGNETIGVLGGTGVVAGTVSLQGYTLTVGNATTSAFSGVISGTGALTKVGSGILDLSGINTYTGATTVNAGTLALAGGSALHDSSAVTVASGASMTLYASETIGSLAGSGNVYIGASRTLTTGGNNTSTTFSGQISTPGSLTKVGTGTLTLSGTNTYTGATTVNAGTLALSGGQAVDDGSAVTVASGATLQLNASETIGSLAGAGSVSLGTNMLMLGSNNISTTLSGAISGTGQLFKVGAGTLTLSGTNSYTGLTTVDAGKLALSGGQAVADTGAVTVASGATLQLDSSETIGELAGAGAVSLNNYTLTTGGLNTSTSFSGSITGPGVLIKDGTGTLTLSGTNHQSSTVVKAGTLALAGGSALADTDAVNIVAGATLSLNATEAIGSLAGAGSVSLGISTLKIGGDNTNSGYGGIISGTGGLVKTGTGMLTLGGANTYTGATAINAGRLTLAGGLALADTDAVSVAAGATLVLGTSETIGSLAGAGAVQLLSDSVLTAGDTANTTFSGVISATSGNGGLVKTGSGTLTLSGTNIYTGGTIVNAGTLALAGGSALADMANLQVNAGATLQLNASETIGALAGAGNVALGAYTLTTGGNDNSSGYGGIISGTGGLVKTGTGTMTLGGANTYTGATTISGGKLLFTGGSALADTGAVTVAMGATLQLDASETIGSLAGAGSVSLGANTLTTGGDNTSTTLSGVISGTGGLTKTGTGTLTITGTDTYTGATTVSAGKLVVNGSLASATTVASGATLDGNGNIGGGVTVQSGGTLAVGGSGTEDLATGNLTLNAGTELAIGLGGTTAATGYDQIDVSGAVDLTGATLNLSLLGGFTPAMGNSFTIIDNDGADAVAGTFAGLAEGATVTVSGYQFKISYIGGDTNDVVLTVVGVPSSGGGGGGDPIPSPVTGTVDGATVQQQTTTNPQTGLTEQTITVPTVTTGRVEDQTTAHSTLADVPVGPTGAGGAIVVSLPNGAGLQATGASTVLTATQAQAELGSSITQHADASQQTQLTSQANDFISHLPTGTTVVTSTLTPSYTGNPLTPPTIVISGSTNVEGQASALVIDVSQLPAGTILQLENVDFAIITGNATLRGGAGQNYVVGGAGTQNICLGADDDELHGGGGNDIIGSAGGNDIVDGGADNDIVYGGIGNDTVIGGEGNDSLFGGKSDQGEWQFYLKDSKVIALHNAELTQSGWESVTAGELNTSIARLGFTSASTDKLSTLAMLYDAAFGRLPDLTGLTYWANSTLSTDQIAQSFTASNEWQQTMGDLNNLAFIEKLYQNVLDRTGETTGVDYWISRLEGTGGNTTLSRTDVFKAFALSAEHQSALQTSNGIALGTETHTTEQNWISNSGNDLLNGGTGSDTIYGGDGIDTIQYDGKLSNYKILLDASGQIKVLDIAAGDIDTISGIEYGSFADGTIDLHFTQDGTAALQKVGLLYQIVLGRAGDIAGVTYWAGQNIDTLQLTASFVNSAEFSGTYGSLNNAAFVTALYQNALHRAPDTAGQAYWESYLSSHSRTELVANWINAPEFVAGQFGTEGLWLA